MRHNGNAKTLWSETEIEINERSDNAYADDVRPGTRVGRDVQVKKRPENFVTSWPFPVLQVNAQ